MLPLYFEPVCFDHAAALIGKSPWEVSRDASFLALAHLTAIRRYGLTSCVVGMDIYNLEAEAYGAEVLPPAGNGIPSLREATFDSLEDLADLHLDHRRGRIPLLLEAARRIAVAEPSLQVSVALSGPFTICSQLLGLENMICDLFSDSARGGEILLHLAGQSAGLIQTIAGQGFGLAIYESAVAPPLLSPDLFHHQVIPALQAVLAAAGGTAQLIIGGNTLPILPDLLSLPAAYLIGPFETDQAAFVEAMPVSWPGILRVNFNPAVFLPGREGASLQELTRICQICEKRSDLQLRCGSLIPYDADPEICLALSSASDDREIPSLECVEWEHL